MTASNKHIYIPSDTPRKTLRTVQDLHEAGLVAEQDMPELEMLTRRYTISVTPKMAELIDTTDTNDPIARQFVPSLDERTVLPQELFDPIGDYTYAPMKALVHRHRNRVLLKPTLVCAVYCRFCFRRDMVGPEGESITQQDVDEALDYIAAHDEIKEVILTGGDPLMLSPQRLQSLMQRLQIIPHVRWIRFHTRVPIVSPNKITSELVDSLKGIKPVYMAIHANHAREFTSEAGAALARLSAQNIMLLGQSVLLKGINNTVETLANLCETMVMNRIKPYYLHHPDLVSGTSHFRMRFEEGIALMNELRERVSGIAMPQYTLDIPGGITKIAISADTIRTNPDVPGGYILRDPTGQEHLYTDALTP